MPVLNISWWNAGNFYHFLPEKSDLPRTRWPKSKEVYEEQLQFVDAAFSELTTAVGKPDIAFFCEMTSESLTHLRDKSFPNYRIISLDVLKGAPTLQIGILFDESKGNVKFVEGEPIVVSGTPKGTRAMAVVDAICENFTIRFIACHWTSRFDEAASHRTRFRIADHLSKYIYQFLNDDRESRHCVVLGDLNEEPFDENMAVLYAHRHRARSKSKVHRADDSVERAHMYNTSWRLMGEKIPHSATKSDAKFYDCAGTFYWESERTWHNFDQIIVSGGLLQDSVPFLDENDVHVISTAKFLADGIPLKFKSDKGICSGLSDHLPLVAKIHI
ncbi:hypothetical protein CLU90_2066 [Janthinobacterium sp. 67]|uniref:endonuclease/exonuclease/phosphatase family protein n=2 Tax=unclassified Janthinobacterium TaxID=2610881 RepID=UPI000CBB5048|nr:hypothetical protein [Janthinobacterium sp. 67]PJJ18859.1 hypothetical protein CLU90_2066 [Janthinobacterium sp. 67]